MFVRSRSWFVVAAALLGVLAAISVGEISSYLADIARARARVASGSRVIATRCGRIEYAEAGEGPAILMIHGAGGGFDQGLTLAGWFAPRGHRVIAMSRFGYLRTPAPAHPSIVAQADAHACLLEALGVPSATVIGVSAGAPSALEFALRHGGRCKALVLLVPGWFPGHPLRRFGPVAEIAFGWALQSDFAFWAFSRYFRTAATRAVLGTPPAVVAAASTAEQARVGSFLRDILPVSQRSAGLMLEAQLTVERLSQPLGSIQAPVLAISARDCLYQTYESARVIIRGVPRGQFIGYPAGGHLLVGHNDEVLEAIERFLQESGAGASSAHPG